MHRILTALLATTLFCLSSEAKTEHLLPKPKSLTRSSGDGFRLCRSVQLNDPTNCAYLKKVLMNAGCTFSEASEAKVIVKLADSLPGDTVPRLAGFPSEAYTLDISAGHIRIKAVDPVGVIRAAQTLQQLAEGCESAPELEPLTLSDHPAFNIRGFMHDTGRSFLPLEELKTQISLLARFKVNVFHWHLTENLAWRFEVKAYPQLTSSAFAKRSPGLFYTQEECTELERFAAERGVTIIPEIDMPGHSEVFTRAMGFNMQTPEGVEALKRILDEVASAFPLAPYIHIGGDEVQITYPDFLRTMADYVRSKGRRVVVWNRLVAGAPTAEECDMTQMWATSGKAVGGLPNIDCRYNYTNHFDTYADVVGIYRSNIYYEPVGTREVAGSISAAWNDTYTPTPSDIVRQNNLYPNILATAERAWQGGGAQYIEKGGTTLPSAGPEYEEFADFERRLLFHKAHCLSSQPIAYVGQSNVRWRISDPMPNGGNPELRLPPETCTEEVLPTSFTYQGKTYQTHLATGAGIYLRHIWHPVVPSFFANPDKGLTAYAWTYVYSPKPQEAGAQVEFYTYSRSGDEVAPPAGQWDRRGSKLWINGEAVAAPLWQQPDATIRQDQADRGLTNENLTARPVVRLWLKQGWNKVFMRLPHADNGGTKRDKWQFTFVLTDPEGQRALDGIVYSPDNSLEQ